MINIPIALFILLMPFALAGIFVTCYVVFYTIIKKSYKNKDLKKGEK